MTSHPNSVLAQPSRTAYFCVSFQICGRSNKASVLTGSCKQRATATTCLIFFFGGPESLGVIRCVALMHRSTGWWDKEMKIWTFKTGDPSTDIPRSIPDWTEPRRLPGWLPAVTEDPERDGRAQKGWNDVNEWFCVSSRQYYFSQWSSNLSEGNIAVHLKAIAHIIITSCTSSLSFCFL